MTTSPRPLVVVLSLVVTLFAVLFGSTAQARPIDVPRPEQRAFVLDLAGMLDDATVAEIRGVADALLTEHATPIVVVTIESMAAHGGEGMRIETFAQILFDEWGVGHPTLAGERWNTGILLLVSKGDRVARIQLGAGWEREHELQAQRIMDDVIVPRFAAGEIPAGTFAGVRALGDMARGKPLPGSCDGGVSCQPMWWWAAVIVVVVIAVLSAVSLVRSGRGGIAWLLWGVVFTILWFVLSRCRTRRHCDGGFRGGSFGGGSSAGRGAIGRW